jgi:hypothetical protein
MSIREAVAHSPIAEDRLYTGPGAIAVGELGAHGESLLRVETVKHEVRLAVPINIRQTAGKRTRTGARNIRAGNKAKNGR